MTNRKISPLQAWRAQYAFIVKRIKARKAVVRKSQKHFSSMMAVATPADWTPAQLERFRRNRLRRYAGNLPAQQNGLLELRRAAHTHMLDRPAAAKAAQELWTANEASWKADQAPEVGSTLAQA